MRRRGPAPSVSGKPAATPPASTSSASSASTRVTLSNCVPFFFAFLAIETVCVLVGLFYGLPTQRIVHIASSMGGLAHSTSALYLAVPEVLSRPYNLNAKNQPRAIKQMCLTTAYFALDSLVCYFSDLPGAPLFIAHHIGSIFVILSCSWAGYGDMTVATMFAIGELSNSPQNIYLILGELELDIGRVLFQPLFLILFIICRLVISPPVYLHFVYTMIFPAKGAVLADGSVPVPFITRLLWGVVMGGILAGSFNFIKDNWHMLAPLEGLLSSSNWRTPAFPAPVSTPFTGDVSCVGTYWGDGGRLNVFSSADAVVWVQPDTGQSVTAASVVGRHLEATAIPDNNTLRITLLAGEAVQLEWPE